MSKTPPRTRLMDVNEHGAFGLLPLYARGLGAMILKHSDDAGRFALGTRTPAEAVARRLGAERGERRTLAGNIQKLVDVGYLRLEEDALVVVEQENRHASRKARVAS